MSRFGGPRGYNDDLAYGDSPQRWDRDRFERMGRGPTSPRQFEEDYRFHERDGPGRRDVAVADRIEERGPRGRFEERDRFFEQDRLAPGPRRRTDRELFGDVDPHELANMAMVPHRAKSSTRRDMDYDRRTEAPARPGLLRRQSSLDTFDRRAPPRHGYEREDYRMAPYQPVPLPYRRDQRYGENYEFDRYRDYEPEDYREVEIQRERSVHRHRPKSHKSHKSAKSSKAKSVTTRRSSSSSSSSSVSSVRKEESIHESIHESVHGGTNSVHETIDKRFKKGKTRMPKRLVRREAIMDLGYPYDEEEDFYVLRIALEKEQIDEVMRISESYKSGEKKTVYEYKEKLDEAPALPPEPQTEREEITRTEWINPPSVVGARSHRSVSHSGRHSSHHHRDSSSHHHLDAASHWSGTTPRGTSPARTAKTSRTSRSRRRSSPGPEFFERKTVIEENNNPPPPPPPAPPVYYEDTDRRTQIVEERKPMSPSGGTLVVQEREYRSDRDINAEIAKLEAERRALRLEREADDRRDMAVRLRERGDEEYQLVEYRENRPREVLELYERERSPPRNVMRVEKDRKERERQRKAKIVAAAMATLS